MLFFFFEGGGGAVSLMGLHHLVTKSKRLCLSNFGVDGTKRSFNSAKPQTP